MCRVLAYIGPELPLESLLLEPGNSLVNQTLDPERHPLLQLAGWGFGVWSEHLLRSDVPLIYRRPTAAFYDDNVERVVPSLRASTMLAHVRAADYNSSAVVTDENCHPFSYEGTPWIIAQNGDLPSWRVLQRELLAHCQDRYLEQMRGTTDTELLYVLLLSLLDGGDRDEDVQRAFEQMLRLIVQAMKKQDRVALAKLKVALVAPNRIIGVNVGCGHDGETRPEGAWEELITTEPGSDDHALGMLLEPMYMLTGRDFENYETSYNVDVRPVEESTSVIFASEPLTESTDDWADLEFGDIVFFERTTDGITKNVRTLDL